MAILGSMLYPKCPPYFLKKLPFSKKPIRFIPFFSQNPKIQHRNLPQEEVADAHPPGQEMSHGTLEVVSDKVGRSIVVGFGVNHTRQV